MVLAMDVRPSICTRTRLLFTDLDILHPQRKESICEDAHDDADRHTGRPWRKRRDLQILAGLEKEDPGAVAQTDDIRLTETIVEGIRVFEQVADEQPDSIENGEELPPIPEHGGSDADRDVKRGFQRGMRRFPLIFEFDLFDLGAWLVLPTANDPAEALESFASPFMLLLPPLEAQKPGVRKERGNSHAPPCCGPHDSVN